MTGCAFYALNLLPGAAFGLPWWEGFIHTATAWAYNMRLFLLGSPDADRHCGLISSFQEKGIYH